WKTCLPKFASLAVFQTAAKRGHTREYVSNPARPHEPDARPATPPGIRVFFETRGFHAESRRWLPARQRSRRHRRLISATTLILRQLHTVQSLPRTEARLRCGC